MECLVFIYLLVGFILKIVVKLSELFNCFFDWFSAFLCGLKEFTCYFYGCSLTGCRNGENWGFYQLVSSQSQPVHKGQPCVYWSVSIYLVEVSSIRLFLGTLYCFVFIYPYDAFCSWVSQFNWNIYLIYHNLPILCNNGFLVSV